MQATNSINHSYLSSKEDTPLMFLSTSFFPTIDKNQPLKFFKGKVKNAFLFRDLLLFLSEVVNSRFYRPDLWRQLDPVITCEESQIMMECFSSCGSIYSRVDIFDSMFSDYELINRGTTNVNFNKEFIEGLLLLKSSSDSYLEVGREDITLESDNKISKEKKVKLPERWIKGFLQSQSILSKAKQIYDLNSINAKKLILECQKSIGDKEFYLSGENNNIKLLSYKPKDNHISVSGLNRLITLKRLIPHIIGLKIYLAEENNTTLWLIKTSHADISFAISASIKNGFSGEGESLRNLSLNRDESLDDLTLEMIKNLGNFDLTQLSELMEVSEKEVIPSIEFLSMNGILGYNSEIQKYFYRVLPFADKKNSRFEDSKSILKKSDVEIEEIVKKDNGLYVKGWVQGNNSKYYTQAFINEQSYIEKAQCNCTWFIKNELKRGPCKHILSLRLFAEFNI